VKKLFDFGLKVFQLGLSASSAGIIAYYDFPDACS
jgi:hypothetical protein